MFGKAINKPKAYMTFVKFCKFLRKMLWQSLFFRTRISKISRSQYFTKIGVLKLFTKLKRRHLSWSLLLIKLEALSQNRCFPVNLQNIFRKLFLQNTPGRLVLEFYCQVHWPNNFRKFHDFWQRRIVHIICFNNKSRVNSFAAWWLLPLQSITQNY